MYFTVTPSSVRDAALSVPGDKSISHRALLLGGIATGRTEVSGFLAGEDCLATLAAMHSLGVQVERRGSTELSIDGVGLHGLRAPADELDLGNSGTAMRLIAGLLCGQEFNSVLVGDHSLTARPMGRIIRPLTSMGASIQSDDEKPPLRITGQGRLDAIDYPLPVASAQVKSAVLLAGLYADGITSVTEPAVTRDHTERMLVSMGVRVLVDGSQISLAGGQELIGCDVQVPGDLSSAAFVILAGLLARNAELVVENVGINPTRTGVIDILLTMGANLTIENRRSLGEEPVADIRVRSSELRGIEVDPALVSLAIDEFPVLFVAAAAASGATVFSDIGELRVKESDRIAAMANALRALGIKIEESPDGAIVHGGRFAGGEIDSHGDHRVAMSMAVAATIASGPVNVRDVEAVDTSFPGFSRAMNSIGGDVEVIKDTAQ